MVVNARARTSESAREENPAVVSPLRQSHSQCITIAHHFVATQDECADNGCRDPCGSGLVRCESKDLCCCKFPRDTSHQTIRAHHFVASQDECTGDGCRKLCKSGLVRCASQDLCCRKFPHDTLRRMIHASNVTLQELLDNVEMEFVRNAKSRMKSLVLMKTVVAVSLHHNKLFCDMILISFSPW